MRRATAFALTGGTLAAVTAGAVVLGRHRGQGPELPASSGEDQLFTQYAPGGPQGFWFNGPIGWAFAKFQPFGHAGLYRVVAEMLDPQPDDDLLDIGCGPGAFLATRAGRVRRVVGLDPSHVMLAEAEKRLADRIAAGTAQLVQASSAQLPFSDGEFSAVTAITAPVSFAEAFRVLRPGGRLVYVDELAASPQTARSERTGGGPWPYTESDTRRIVEEAGFTDLAVRYLAIWRLADNRIVACRKPALA
jgi:SAM-dependent methyltransferase